MILLIDNYDSFSYNLYQLIGSLRGGEEIEVVRNDEISVEQIASLSPERIILSPGPGRPRDAGICEEAVKAFAGRIPILGVCLGHQAICEAFGANVVQAGKLMHGKPSEITVDTECAVFSGMDPVMQGARYHSLTVEESSLPAELRVVGRSEDGQIMAAAHREYAVYGLQFHPESILTPRGTEILNNFLHIPAGGRRES